LDRIAHGLVAEDIINAADELAVSSNNSSSSLVLNGEQPGAPTLSAQSQTGGNAGGNLSGNKSQSNMATAPAAFSTPMIISSKSLANQTIALAHILQKRNFHNSIKAISHTKAGEQRKSIPIKV
jgi:hypothetical protein